MTIISQRLFCFVVALLVATSREELFAQNAAPYTVAGLTGPTGAVIYSGSATGMLSDAFAQANNPVLPPVAVPALSFSSLAQRSLEGNFAQHKGILPVAGPLMGYPVSFLPGITVVSDGSTASQPERPARITRQFIPVNNYYIQSGFFCKREWEMERSTHIPFRFRVGSLADCNALEGKP